MSRSIVSVNKTASVIADDERIDCKNNLSSRVAPQVNYNLSRQITNVICPDRFFACISRAMWKTAAIVPARMDAGSHMASKEAEEPGVPKGKTFRGRILL